MCMENAARITSDKVPKYGWKVLRKNEYGEEYFTPYWEQEVELGTWTKAEGHKDGFSIHHGRVSILENKEDAIAFHKLLSKNLLHSPKGTYLITKVLIKQTTKYAFKGEMTFYETDSRQRHCITYAVDQIKTVEE